MVRRDRPGNRWKTPSRSIPTIPTTLLTERDKRIRRMRQDRLSGDLSHLQTTTESPSGCGSTLRVARAQRRKDQGDIIGALHDFRDALQVDRNCYEAWLGLSVIFHELADGTRAGRCLGIARTLRPRVPGITATV